MQERGKWTHGVPRQEEGEPAPKHARWYERTVAGADLARDYDDPLEGTSKDHLPPAAPVQQPPEGTLCLSKASLCWLGSDMMLLC